MRKISYNEKRRNKCEYCTVYRDGSCKWQKCHYEPEPEVLTCSNGGFIEIQSLENSHGNIYWENQNGDWTDIDGVIAWMPLPKPYEPQERIDER